MGVDDEGHDQAGKQHKTMPGSQRPQRPRCLEIRWQRGRDSNPRNA